MEEKRGNKSEEKTKASAELPNKYEQQKPGRYFRAVWVDSSCWG